MAKAKRTDRSDERKPRVAVFPSVAAKKRRTVTPIPFSTMAQLKAAVMARAGWGPTSLSPGAWPDREKLQEPQQRTALEWLERLRKGVQELREDVDFASAFVKQNEDSDGAVTVLKQWLDVFALSNMVIPERSGEVARFVRYNDGLADADGVRLADRELALALLRSGWWPNVRKTALERLTVGAIVKLATNAVRDARRQG